MKFKQPNQIPLLQTLANQSTLNKAHVIEIAKACTVASMKARNSLVVVECREKNQLEKKTEDDENLFFKALANRFWLKWKSYSWFQGWIQLFKEVSQKF